MKVTATALLLLMAALYLTCRAFEGQYPGLAYLRAFSEAAMIGGLADWFAVVALFRHPLGLPIPHTAIIPANKDRIGESLGSFIQENFLSEEVIGRKSGSLDVAGFLARWLTDPEHTEQIADRIVGFVPHILSTLEDEDVHRFIHRYGTKLIKDLNLALVAGDILTTLSSGGKHQKLLNEILLLIERALEHHEAFLRETIREEMPWYIPDFLHDKVYESVLTRTREILREAHADPEHRVRKQLHQVFLEFVRRLRESPDYREKGEQFKEWLLTSPILSDYIVAIWRDVRRLIERDLPKPDSQMKKAVQHFLSVAGEGLSHDQVIKEKLNGYIHSGVRAAVRTYHREIIAFISETVRAWDTRTITEKIEEHVGRDLQYIRLNGTFVGGAAGLLLYILFERL